MKKVILVILISLAPIVSTSVDASGFFNSNNGEWKMGPNGPYWDESDWPEWTPMYWMEEFMDSWDNNNWGGNNYGYGNYNYAAPYNAYPYGYNVPYGNYTYPQLPTNPPVTTPK